MPLREIGSMRLKLENNGGLAQTELTERLIMSKNSVALIPLLFLAAFGALLPQKQNVGQQTNTQQQTTGQSADKASTKPAGIPRLEFDVASIKPGNPKDQDSFIKADPGGETYRAVNADVRLMIQLMWKLHDNQIVGAPDWVAKDLWDVEAKADGPHNIDDLHTMYQNMIIDRFKMQFHWDSRDLPMFALLIDKSGPKMTVNTDPEPFNFPFQGVAFGKFQAKHCDLRYFTWFISQFPWVGRPVVDETGLDKSKFYDFTLAFDLGSELPPEVAARGNLPPAPGPDFFVAIREQLGLRLESKKGPVPVMVIDHIEKPTSSDN